MSENKKAPMENGAKENHGISNSTGMLAVAESDVKSFLKCVCAGGGVHALMVKAPKGVRLSWCTDTDGLVASIVSGTDNWFAPASFKSHSRKANNVAAVSSLWLDVDIGAEHAHADYAAEDEFRSAFDRFMRETGLPAPWIVATGHGVHLYWTVGRDLPPEKWRALMQMLFSACDAHGLKYDHAASDASRVLRMPGTYNYKGEPVPVLIKQAGESDPCRLVTVLKKYRQAEVRDSKPQNTGRTMREPDGIVNGCEQIRMCGSADYETWRNAARCLTFCEHGYELFHQLSEGDSRYDVDKVNAVWDSLDKDDLPPILCSTFATGQCGKLCAQCPHRGQVTTPVMLGTPVRSASASNDDGLPQGTQPADPALTPFHSKEFAVIPGKGITWTFTDKATQEDKTILIAPFEFYITGLVIDDRMITPRRTYKSKAVFHDGSFREFDFVVDDMYKSGYAPARILTEYGMAVHPSYMDQMVKFMKTYIAKVQNSLAPSFVRDHFGWYTVQDMNGQSHDEFVVGRQTYAKNDIKETYLDSRALAMAEHKMTTAGNLEAWKQIPRLYRELDQKSAQLLMCASFGSVFMPLGIGTATNVMYNFYDTIGGKGKSSLLSALASVWGDPSSLPLGRTDTISAKYQQYSVYHNLPILIDEITGMKAEDMAAMLYDLVNGREKNRSNRSGTELQRGGSWQTITVSTSNQSVYEMLKAFREQTLATSMRVIEMRCDFKDYTGDHAVTDRIDAVMTAVHSNYGVAGRAFIQYILADDGVKKEVMDSVAAFSARYRKNNDERFWITGLGVALAAGRIAVRMGLLDYDIDALEKWVGSNLLANMREAVKDSRQSPVSILADFITDNINNTLIVSEHNRKSSEPPVGMPDPYVIIEPRGSLQIRRELDTNTVMFKRSALVRWADMHGVSAATLLDDLRRDSSASVMDIRQDLGQGVKRFASARQRCISIQLAALAKRLPTVTDVKLEQGLPVEPDMTSDPDMADGEGEGECPF